MTIIKTAEADQEEQDKKQEAHGKLVAEQLEASAANLRSEDATRLTNTKQTVKSHLGKAPWDQDKSEDMEAKKVGKFVEPPTPITEVMQSADVIDPDTGEVSEETVDIIQVPTLRAEMGLAIPAGAGFGNLTEPEKTHITVADQVEQTPIEPGGGGESGGPEVGHHKARKKKRAR